MSLPLWGGTASDDSLGRHRMGALRHRSVVNGEAPAARTCSVVEHQ